jgi:hypothetical protein
VPIHVRQATADDLPRLLHALGDDALARSTALLGSELAPFVAWLQAAPEGCRAWIADDGDAIVALLCAVPRATRVGGERRAFTELVGAWVAPHRRRLLRRESDLGRVASALFEAHQGVEGDFVYHGLPGLAERRLLHARLDFKPIGTLPLLDVPVPLRAAPAADVVGVECFDARFGELFERCAPELGAATVRDARFLEHRFGRHPAGGFHTLACVGGDGALRGYAVLRAAAGVDGAWLLWDWLVPLGDEPAGRSLLQSALAVVGQHGGRRLAGFVPETSPWFDRLQELGARVRPWAPFAFARTTSRRHDVHWLHEHWWHTLADTVLQPAVPADGGER